MAVKLRSRASTGVALGRGQLLRAAVGAIGAAALAGAVAPGAAEAAYIPGAGGTPDRVDRDLQVDGRLNVQSGKLYVSGSSMQVGIGTDAPGLPLDVTALGTELQIGAWGSVDRGGLQLGNYVFLQGHIAEANNWDRMLLAEGAYYDSANNRFELINAQYDRAGIEFENTGNITFHAEWVDRSTPGYMTREEWASTERMVIMSNGNVGIGTGTPCRKLDVDGDIRAMDALYAGSTKIADEGGCYYAP
jgi:hypothetical protein